LNGYRRNADVKLNAELQTFCGRTIDVPSTFISGKSDWGVYQTPGAVERMSNGACTKLVGFHLVDEPITGCSKNSPSKSPSCSSSFCGGPLNLPVDRLYAVPFASGVEKHFRLNRGLPQDRSKCSLWHIAGMIRNRCVAASRRVEPDLVTTGGLAVKLESKGPQLSNDFAIAKSREAAHGQAATTIV
jgi:hypothetical protein